MYESLHGEPIVLKSIQRETKEINSRWQKDNPYDEPHEGFMMHLRDPHVVQNIAEHLEPAKMFVEDELSFTRDELKWLYGFAFSECLNVRHNANGTIFMSGNLHKIVEKFINKLSKILPGCENSPSVAGNFLITPSQYGLHTDSTRESDWVNSLSKIPLGDSRRKYVPWRNILIPMWIGGSPDTVSHAVFFDQRHIDFAHVYLHGRPYDKDPATTYPIVYNHSEIDFYNEQGKLISREDNNQPYDVEHWKQYLEYTPYKRLTGLTPSLTTEWIPGKPFVFDAFQLHATNRGTNVLYGYKHVQIDKQGIETGVSKIVLERDTWALKMGLLLTFLREVK
jgi:hypothetical protein